MILKYDFGDYDDFFGERVYFDYEVKENLNEEELTVTEYNKRYDKLLDKYRQEAYEQYRDNKLYRKDPATFYGV